MKKILITALAALLVLTFLATPVFAEMEESSVNVAVADEAGALSEEEYYALEDRILSIESTYGFDIAIVIPYDLMGMSALTYGDEYGGISGADGAVFVHYIEGRDYATSTRGTGRSIYSGSALDKIDEVMVPALQDGDYYAAYSTFLDESETFLSSYASGSAYAGDPKGITDYILPAIIALVLGIIIAFLVTGSMKAKMKTAVKKTEAADYVRPGSFNVTHSADRYLFQNTIRTPKPKSDSGSRTNSSGGSRGGRGGSY